MSTQKIVESSLFKRNPKAEHFGTSPSIARSIGSLDDGDSVVFGSRKGAIGGGGRPSTQSVLGKWGISQSHDSISAAAEQSEKEHLHVMVNKLTLENIELRTTCASSQKHNCQLENKVKELDEELQSSKKQINEANIAEKELGESTLVRSDWALESESSTSLTSQSIATGSLINITDQIKTPGIVIQLSTNPWQEDQESQALRELVNILIGSMSPPEDGKTSDTHGLGFVLDVMKPKDSFDYQTSNEDQYLLPVELSDIERLTAVMNTRKIVSRCNFEKELTALDGDMDEDKPRFYLDMHRTPDGNICESDIENIITSLKFERNKNTGLLDAVKELEQQQYELTHSRRAALIHLERERTQNKRLATVITALKQQKRLPLTEQGFRNKASKNQLGGTNTNIRHAPFANNRWFLLATGALIHVVVSKLFTLLF